MKLITERDRIKRAIIHHCNIWGDTSRFKDAYRIQYDSIVAKLKALDPEKATTEELSEILGNECWRGLTCYECGVDANAIVEIGEEPDYDSATARVCLDCINKAAKLLT